MQKIFSSASFFFSKTFTLFAFYQQASTSYLLPFSMTTAVKVLIYCHLPKGLLPLFLMLRLDGQVGVYLSF